MLHLWAQIIRLPFGASLEQFFQKFEQNTQLEHTNIDAEGGGDKSNPHIWVETIIVVSSAIDKDQIHEKVLN